MPNYRRYRVPGGTYFFTVNLLERRQDTLVRHIGSLRDAVRKTRHQSSFHIDAWVVLPDHMHCIWTLPPGDDDFFLLACRGMLPRHSRFADGGIFNHAKTSKTGQHARPAG